MNFFFFFAWELFLCWECILCIININSIFDKTLKNRRDRKYVYKFPPNVKLSLKPTSANMFVPRLHTNTFSNNSFVNAIYPPRVFYIQYSFLIFHSSQSSNTTYSSSNVRIIIQKNMHENQKIKIKRYLLYYLILLHQNTR